ncbi:cardiolipin synthase (CMP-forming) [Osmerus mordax]|uniref:Cardiolipin synthase (CMP-forming) n=1 Tax=Osmerus mordax TaxID=8014 RepID=C1BJF2_OSMMO|nr:Cardiolipin synthetase [Osmerus mordax]
MLLSICKSSLVVCARGHVASCAVATRYASVCRAAPESWRQKQTPADCSRELWWLHKLKHRIASVAQWSGYTYSPSHAPELFRHLAAPCQLECVTGHSNWKGRQRTLPSSVPSSAGFSLRFQHRGDEAAHNLLGVRLSPLSPGVPQGCRGFSSGNPSQPPAEKTPSKDLRNTNTDSPQVPGQGLFQFKELYENPWTIPNLLCVCRILLAPVLGYLITEQHFHLSLALFLLAGATDLLDGYIARTWPNQKSALGSALDPLADKILISVLYISLTYAQIIPAPLTALVISRDIALIAAVFYVRYKTVPPPVTLSRFFNPCYTTAQLKPTLISKVNTAIQLLLGAASLAAPVFYYTDSFYLQSLWYITAVTTAASGYSYYHYGKKTVEVLNNTNK